MIKKNARQDHIERLSKVNVKLIKISGYAEFRDVIYGKSSKNIPGGWKNICLKINFVAEVHN